MGLVLVGSSRCEYCVKAEDLLDYWNIEYRYVPYVNYSQFQEDGHLTVPQIYWEFPEEAHSAPILLVEGGYHGLVGVGKAKLKKSIKELSE